MSRVQTILQRIAQSPDDTFLNYALAMEYRREEQMELSIQTFEKILKLDADYVPAYFQLGQVLAQIGKKEAARRALTTGIDVARRIDDLHAAGEMTEFLETL